MLVASFIARFDVTNTQVVDVMLGNGCGGCTNSGRFEPPSLPPPIAACTPQTTTIYLAYQVADFMPPYNLTADREHPRHIVQLPSFDLATSDMYVPYKLSSRSLFYSPFLSARAIVNVLAERRICHTGGRGDGPVRRWRLGACPL